MNRRNEDHLKHMKSEWIGGGSIVLRDDPDPQDHAEINAWILNFLDQDHASDEDDHIVNCIYHNLNFDIPFKATEGMRQELLNIARTKLKEPRRTRFRR